MWSSIRIHLQSQNTEAEMQANFSQTQHYSASMAAATLANSIPGATDAKPQVERRGKPRWLLPSQPELDHHSFLPFLIDHEVAMEENATVFLKVGARDSFTARMFGIERCGP